uniref:Uncharacterized protein n=1 Tax=Kalanchoe fedtschenkoi TaxID=63787 RepID=A0A7N0TBL2_KALFE
MFCLLKSNVISWNKFPMLFGTLPDNPFPLRFSSFKFLKFTTLCRTPPSENLLKPRFKTDKFPSCTSSPGTFPVSMFSPRSSISRLERLPNCNGMEPEK